MFILCNLGPIFACTNEVFTLVLFKDDFSILTYYGAMRSFNVFSFALYAIIQIIRRKGITMRKSYSKGILPRFIFKRALYCTPNSSATYFTYKHLPSYLMKMREDDDEN